VHDLGAQLLGDQRETGLLPRKAGGTVRDGGRSGHHRGVRSHPAVALGIGPLGRDREIGTGKGEGLDEAVHIATDTASVSGNSGGVDEDARSNVVHARISSC